MELSLRSLATASGTRQSSTLHRPFAGSLVLAVSIKTSLTCSGKGLYSFLLRQHAELVGLAAGAEHLICKLPARKMGDMYDAEAPKLRDDGVAMLEKPC